MTKTMDEIREEFAAVFRTHIRDFGIGPGLLKTTNWWLSIIEQRDRELREKIEKLIDSNDDGMWAGRETADRILALLSPHNKENER